MKNRKWYMSLVFVGLLFMAGCASFDKFIDDWSKSQTNVVVNVDVPVVTNTPPVVPPVVPPITPPVITADEVDFGNFVWSYGGFKGEEAVLDTPRIKGLSMSANGLAYSWDGATLSAWGLGDTDYSGALACLFVQRGDGTWVGGKFDWISTSRKTRGFENIHVKHYNGWTLDGIPNPCNAAFVIVSEDGHKRTNVIAGKWKR